jgi:hypothetical protein
MNLPQVGVFAGDVSTCISPLTPALSPAAGERESATQPHPQRFMGTKRDNCGRGILTPTLSPLTRGEGEALRVERRQTISAHERDSDRFPSPLACEGRGSG